MKKLELKKQVVRELEIRDLKRAQGGVFNLSINGGCNSHFCTTAVDCPF